MDFFFSMRVLNTVPWLGADNCGTIVIAPKEIIRYHWWFFPKTPNQLYETTVTCSCVCLIDGRYLQVLSKLLGGKFA